MSTKPRKTPSTQTKASTPSRLSASTAEVIPVELSAETFERGPLPARIQGRVINPQHKLKITSLHDAQASCSCGWSLVHTGKLTRAEIRAKWWSHKRAVAALTFCIIPGCTGTKLEGRKYCAAHQERANGQTLQEKVTEQRACQHATRAEERVCEAEQEAIANGNALEAPCAGCGNTPQACDCNTLNTDTITTILAALRLFQREFDGCSAGKVAEVFPDHFTEGMQSVSPRPLMSEEIDALCQAINTSGLKYHRLLHISDFTCSQCDFTAYAMVDMSAHWTATGHSGCRADIINPAKAEPSKTWTPPNDYRQASANLLTESIRAASALRGILADAVKSAKYPSESATSTQSLDAGRKAISLLQASIAVFQTAQRADMQQNACPHGAYPGPCYLCDPLAAADARMAAEDDRKTPPAMGEGESDMERDRRG